MNMKPIQYQEMSIYEHIGKKKTLKNFQGKPIYRKNKTKQQKSPLDEQVPTKVYCAFAPQ